MSIEERLRDAFAQRAEGVEVSPGALFEIQRRAGHRRRVLRVPEVRLRPALVLAAAACAAIAVAISVSVTGPSAAPIVTETQPVAGTADPAAVAPTTAEPPPTTQSPDPAPPASAQVDPQSSDSGQITTAPATTPPTPPTPPAPVTPAPPPEVAPATDTTPDGDTAATETPAAETPACPEQPEGNGGDSTSELVTVYFACGESDAAPRQRAAAANNLPTALGILLGGPSEADSTAGFRGLSGNTATTVTTMTSNRWLTIDLPAGLADAFGTDDGDITAQQFLTQLNATVFQFSDFNVVEYRLAGDCAAFGALAGDSCRIHIRDGADYASRTSELTAHTIGDVSAVIRAEPDDGAEELGVLQDGSRLTGGRSGSGSDAWAEVVTTAGDTGWVSTQTIVAQPLSIDGTTRAAMESLARRLTTGPGLESSALLPAGLVLRWGADAGDLSVVSTAGAAAGSDWWSTPVDTPSPRDGSATSSLADLLWIDGSGDGATVTVNTPGPLGEPHGDFASLAYVSIYRSAIESSVLPPPIPTTTTTTTTQATTGEGSDLPPALPTPEDETDDGDGQPASPRAQISAIFDFLSPDGPRIAAVEAIWIQP